MTHSGVFHYCFAFAHYLKTSPYHIMAQVSADAYINFALAVYGRQTKAPEKKGSQGRVLFARQIAAHHLDLHGLPQRWTLFDASTKKRSKVCTYSLTCAARCVIF